MITQNFVDYRLLSITRANIRGLSSRMGGAESGSCPVAQVCYQRYLTVRFYHDRGSWLLTLYTLEKTATKKENIIHLNII